VWVKNLEFMMGMIRKIIVVGGALLAMPSPPPSEHTGGVAQNTMPSSSWTYISAAAETVADVKGFCARKPQVCGTAQYLAASLEGKAKYSAKLVYEWASESSSGSSYMPQSLALADPIKTGSADVQVASSLSGNTTLRMEDLIPEWRGTIEPEKG
jgi:hypothetical protein